MFFTAIITYIFWNFCLTYRLAMKYMALNFSLIIFTVTSVHICHIHTLLIASLIFYTLICRNLFLKKSIQETHWVPSQYKASVLSYKVTAADKMKLLSSQSSRFSGKTENNRI